MARWSYEIRYCPSIQHAFNALRWEVFRDRAYEGDATARSIHSLRRAQGEQGTASILDMQWVASEPASEVVAPLSPAELRAVFGTVRPTLAQIRAAELPQRPPWQGTYVIAYEHDVPHTIVFYGRSGASVGVEREADVRAARSRRATRAGVGAERARRAS